MSFATLIAGGQELAILEARLERGLGGPWVGRLTVDTVSPISGRVSVVAPGLRVEATVVAGGPFGASSRLSIVGGAGGLGRMLAARVYRGVKLGLVLADLAKDAGEQLDPESSATTLARSLPRWVRPVGTTGAALDALILGTGARWSVTDAGLVRVGADVWTPLALAHVVAVDDAAARRAVIAPEDASLRPGHVLEGRKVHTVIHQIGEVVRTTASYL